MRVLSLLLLSLASLTAFRATVHARKPEEAPATQGVNKRVAATKSIVAAIVEAARKNQQLPLPGAPGARAPFRLEKEELTALYFREAAKAAMQLPEADAVPAYLLALGITLDKSDLMRQNFMTSGFWQKVETDDERKRRIAVLGEPLIQGRYDLAQHFTVSAALTVLLGAKYAENAGIVKEMLDASDPDNGFSFNDLSADLAGVAFAQRLLDAPRELNSVAKKFQAADYTIMPNYRPEGLPAREFARQFGSVTDERFLERVAEIRKRLTQLPGFKTTAVDKP